MSGIIRCVLVSVNSVPQFVLKWCRKEHEKNQVKKVTAKSSPMMSLIGRGLSTLSSSASESQGKRNYESQSLLSAQDLSQNGETPLLAVTQVTSQATTIDSLKVRTHQATQDGTIWKSDELMDDRWGPRSKSVALTPSMNSQRHLDLRKFYTWW